MIKIKNRYNDEVVFTEVEPNKWLVKTNASDMWGVSGSVEKINSIDPSGGPYITIGYTIPTTNKKVKEIIHNQGFYLITE